MRCPWPAIRLARAMRENKTGTVRIIADDPQAPAEIAALAAERGWRVAEIETEIGRGFAIST